MQNSGCFAQGRPAQISTKKEMERGFLPSHLDTSSTLAVLQSRPSLSQASLKLLALTPFPLITHQFIFLISFLLKCNCDILNYKADFLAIDVARSEGAIFDVSNSHLFYLSFFLSVFIIPYFRLFVNRFLKSFLFIFPFFQNGCIFQSQ